MSAPGSVDDWRMQVPQEYQSSSRNDARPVGVKKHEASTWATAKSLQEYNANIKKAAEAEIPDIAKAKQGVQSPPYVPPPPTAGHGNPTQATITALPDAMAMPFSTSYQQVPAGAPGSAVASPAGQSFSTYTAAVPKAGGTAQFNKLPAKPAAYAAVPKTSPAPTYAPPPSMINPAAPTAVSMHLAAPPTLTAAELAADEKCWQKLEAMRAKFDGPLRTICETLQKSGKEDANIIPVQKMIEFLNTPREGRPKRSYEDLEKTELKMRQYFERMYQKKAAVPARGVQQPRPPAATDAPMSDTDHILEMAKRIDGILHDNEQARVLWGKAIAATIEKVERRQSVISPSSFPALSESNASEPASSLRQSRSDAGGVVIARDAARVAFTPPTKRARV